MKSKLNNFFSIPEILKLFPQLQYYINIEKLFIKYNLTEDEIKQVKKLVETTTLDTEQAIYKIYLKRKINEI